LFITEQFLIQNDNLPKASKIHPPPEPLEEQALDLNAFDNTEYDIRTPSEWVSHVPALPDLQPERNYDIIGDAGKGMNLDGKGEGEKLILKYDIRTPSEWVSHVPALPDLQPERNYDIIGDAGKGMNLDGKGEEMNLDGKGEEMNLDGKGEGGKLFRL
jgi:hypothetical protein